MVRLTIVYKRYKEKINNLFVESKFSFNIQLFNSLNIETLQIEFFFYSYIFAIRRIKKILYAIRKALYLNVYLLGVSS